MTKMKRKRNIIAIFSVVLVLLGIFAYFGIVNDISQRSLVVKSQINMQPQITQSSARQENQNHELKYMLAKRKQIATAIQEKEREEAVSSPEEDYEPNVRNLSPVEITKRLIRNRVIRDNATPKDIPQYFESMIEEQQKDEYWKKNIEAALREELSQRADLEADVEEIDCRNTLCKIVVEHGSMELAEEFAKNIINRGRLHSSSQGFTRLTDDKRIISTYYKARPGEGENVHDAVYNKMYEQFTGKKFEDIEPSEEQVDKTIIWMNETNVEQPE